MNFQLREIKNQNRPPVFFWLKWSEFLFPFHSQVNVVIVAGSHKLS